MPFELTTEGLIREIPDNLVDKTNPEHVVFTAQEQWEEIASNWPLKRLVAIWNDLPGVTPVEKFTNRHIAVQRIWRALASPEQVLTRTQPKREKSKAQFREGSKAAQVYALLCRPEGATVREIQDLTGWQRHSVRGFLSASVRKQGSRIRSFERGGERAYRVKS